MNISGDAAEQTFRMAIEGTEFVLKISGNLVKETATLLYAISKDKEQTNIGKTNLAKMLRNCKDTKLFAIQRKDLNKFVSEAKNYGIYYCTLINKNDKSDDSIVDILVRGDDASRVNRIVERFDLSITDTASLRTEIVKEKEEVTEEKGDAPVQEKAPSEENQKIEEITEKIQVSEDEVKKGASDNFLSQEGVPSETSLKNKKEEIQGNKENRKSVREQLKEITEELKKSSKEEKEKTKDKKGRKKNKKEKGDSKVKKHEQMR